MSNSEDTLADRLIAARVERGLSQTDLAKIAHVSQTTVASLETGRARNSRYLVLIAKALGVDSDWLLTGDGDKDSWDVTYQKEALGKEEVPARRPPWDAYRLSVARYRYGVKPGTQKVEWESEVDNAIAIPMNALHQLRRRPEDCRALEMRDDSMEPLLFRGEFYVVDSLGTTPREGKIFAVNFEDEQLVRQVFKEAGGALRLHALNPKYADKAIPAEHVESLVIVGEVIYREGHSFAL